MGLKEVWTKIDNALNPFSEETIETSKRALQAHSLQVGGAILNKGLIPKATQTLVQDTLEGRLIIKDWRSVLGKEEVIAGFVEGLPENSELEI